MKWMLTAILLVSACAGAFAGTFNLFDPGTEKVVQYEKYGTFKGIGTSNYKYEITDWDGLKKAVGEGIYPNEDSVIRDPKYREFLKSGLLSGSQWDHISSPNPQADFYKWATTNDDPGVKLLYEATALENAGLYEQAVKALYALAINFPGTACWSAEQTFVWYAGPVAIGKIKEMLNEHPELELKLVDAEVDIDSKGDTDTKNDIVVVNPGKFIKWTLKDRMTQKSDVSRLKIVKRIGSPAHELVKFSNGNWQFRVNGKPYIIKGMSYGSTKVGHGPADNNMDDWMQMDYDKNGKIDGPYDTWVDKNHNNKRDADEPVIGDFQLLNNMGCNTIRIYHHASNKAILSDLYSKYGISIILGDFFGAYSVGSGSTWEKGTDYGDPVQRKNMLDSVRQMVTEYKDEPYVLLWSLGNENNYGVANNYRKDPEGFFKFMNEAAKMIKQLDPTRPVAICNGDVGEIRIFARNCPDIDIYGVNAYRGGKGFGDLWESIREKTGKAGMILEFGCPSYSAKGMIIGEQGQSDYLLGCWNNIMSNTAGNGEGDAIGGVVFEWVDEWWKCGDDMRNGVKYSADTHDCAKLGAGPFPDGWGYSEWFGITGQGNGSKSPFLRELRQAYFSLQGEWTKIKP